MKKKIIWPGIIWICTFTIVVGHIVAYSKDWFGIDQLIPCVLGYPSIAVLLHSMLPE